MYYNIARIDIKELNALESLLNRLIKDYNLIFLLTRFFLLFLKRELIA